MHQQNRILLHKTLDSYCMFMWGERERERVGIQHDIITPSVSLSLSLAQSAVCCRSPPHTVLRSGGC